MIMENRPPGETIRAIRIKRGFTQKDIADSLGTTVSSVSRYESGNRQMTVDKYEQILDILGAVHAVFVQE